MTARFCAFGLLILTAVAFSHAQNTPPPVPPVQLPGTQQPSGTPSMPPAVPDTQSTAGAVPPAPVPAAQPPEAGMSIEDALRKAREHMEAKRFQAAMELIRPVLQASPSNTEANLLAGEILIEGNNYDTAREYFKVVLKNEPSSYRANLGLGKIWIANRLWQQASSYLEEAEKVAPEKGRSEVKRLIAYAYMQQGKTQDGIDKCIEAIQSDPDDLDALRTLVELRQSLANRNPGQLEPALVDGDRLLAKITAALARKPADRELVLRLKGALEMMSAMPPSTGLLQTYYGTMCMRDSANRPIDRLVPGRGPDAAAVLMRITEINRLAALLNMIQNEQTSAEVLERAVSENYDPKNVRYLEALAACYQQLQDLTARVAGPAVYNEPTLRERAADVYRRILEIDPQHEVARKFLAAIGGAAPATQPSASAGPTR